MLQQSTIQTVCITGHRDIPPEHALRLPQLLEEQIGALYARGARIFRAGGAMGFDTLAALKVLECREQLPELELHLYLPCRDQAAKWDAVSRRAYEYVLSRADSVDYTAEKYEQGCMLARDRKLIRGGDVCLAYCSKNKGGTFYTLSYAVRLGLELINLSEFLRRDSENG